MYHASCDDKMSENYQSVGITDQSTNIRELRIQRTGVRPDCWSLPQAGPLKKERKDKQHPMDPNLSGAIGLMEMESVY